MKYILLGFPKSGTMSFHNLFEEMGLKSAHWIVEDGYVGELIHKAKSEEKKLLHYLSDMDCITQMDVCLSHELNHWPQIDLYKDIYEQYPEALYILNVRSPQKILKSFKKWGNLYERVTTYSSINEYRGDSVDDKILNWIEDHYADVRSFFKSKPNFLEFAVGEDSIEQLREPLSIPAHITAFPHANKNRPEFQKKLLKFLRMD